MRLLSINQITKLMKPLLFIVALLVCFKSYGQTEYYFANNGDDSNSGKITSPFKTINKLNTLSLKPGDNVHFKCGDTFIGQVNVLASGTQSSPITFGSYGQGSKPIINASIEIKNWTKQSGKNVWQAPLSRKGLINELYINSRVARLSRYPQSNAPNKGYLTIASHSGKTQITSKERINGNWVGGELVFMPNQFLIERCKITAQNGNTFTIAQPNNYDIADGWGFFVQNHVDALTNNGDWSVDTSKNLVSIYDNDNPNNQKVEATYASQGIYMVNCSNIVVSNLELDKTLCGVSAGNISNVTLKDLKINHPAEDGIRIRGKCSDISIEDNEIINSNNDGIYIYKANNLKIVNNTIKNAGLIAGRGKSGTGQYTGIDCTSDAGNVTIQGNRLDSVGYLGIDFTSANIVVKNNVVSNFCLIKSDGGGIYTFNGPQKDNTNQVVSDNIVLGCPVDVVPIKNVHFHVDGIYMDDCSQNVTISGNTIASCQNSGIFLHGSKNVTVTGNTCYNNTIQFSLNRSQNCDNVGNQVQNNIFFSRTKAQPVAIYGKQKDPNSDYGVFNNNMYVSPDTTQSVLSGFEAETKDSRRISLGGWKSKFSKDKNSRSIGGPAVYNNDIKFVYNASPQPKTVQLNGKYKDFKNNVVDGQVTLQPYSSAILVASK